MNDNNIIIKLLAVNPAHAYHVISEIPGEVGNVKFMIDTGAAVSLIREDIWKRVAGSEPTLKDARMKDRMPTHWSRGESHRD